MTKKKIMKQHLKNKALKNKSNNRCAIKYVEKSFNL